LREFRPDAPEGLEKVIIKCLEKEPWDRYKSVAELAKALLPYAPERSRTVVERIGKILERAGMPSFHDMDVTVTVGSATGTTGSDVGARTASSWSGTQGGDEPASTSKNKLFLGLGAAAALAAGLGYAFFPKTTPLDAEASAVAAAPSGAPSAVVAKTAEVPEVLPAPPASSAPEVAIASPSDEKTRPPDPRPGAKPAAKPSPKPEAKKPDPPPEKPAAKPDPAPPKPVKNPLDMGLK
jgi:serine/threonine-protein kinase